MKPTRVTQWLLLFVRHGDMVGRCLCRICRSSVVWLWCLGLGKQQSSYAGSTGGFEAVSCPERMIFYKVTCQRTNQPAGYEF